MSGNEDLIETLICFLTEDAELREEAAYELSELRDAKVLEPLIKVLQNPNSEVRRWAAWSIADSKLDITPRLESLIAASKDVNSLVRANVILAIGMGGNLQDKKVYQVLTQALFDEEIEVRKTAAFVLSIHAEPETFSALIKALTDKNNAQILTLLIRALGNVGDTRALPYFEVLLENNQINSPDNVSIKQELIRGINKLKQLDK